MAGAEPDFFYPFSDDCKNFMTQWAESAYVFSLHIGLHVSCYSLITIPRHEDFCKWRADILSNSIFCLDLDETNNNVISTEGKKSIVICFVVRKLTLAKACQRIDTLLRRYDIRWQAFLLDE